MHTDVTRACTSCRLVKPIGEFHFANKARGKRHARCRACMAEYGRRYYRRNKQHIIDRSMGWQYENPWRFRASMVKLRAKRLGKLDQADPVEIDFVVSLFEKAEKDGHCPLCGVEFDFGIYLGKGQMPLNSPQVDHIVPLGGGGMHVPSNLRIVCRSCNSRFQPKPKSTNSTKA